MDSKASTAGGKQNIVWRTLDRALEIMTVSLLACIVILMSIQIIMRYIGMPLKWSDEIAKYSMVWMTFLGSVIVIGQGAHVYIDALVAIFPKKAQKAAWLFTNICCLIFFAVLAWYGAKFAIMNINNRSLVTGIPRGYIFSVIPVSAVLMIAYQIRSMKEASEWNY